MIKIDVKLIHELCCFRLNFAPEEAAKDVKNKFYKMTESGFAVSLLMQLLKAHCSENTTTQVNFKDCLKLNFIWFQS
jgi:hypothetical protein